MIRKGRAEKERKKADKERLKSFGHNPDSDSDEDDLEEALTRDMDEGAGRMDNAQKRKLQSRMLEATFEMYFRVLKNAASVAPARGTPLMTPALVGLGKFTHLVSVSFMADLMEVFRQLLAGETLGVDQKARVLLTACEILSGHGEALHVDTGEFHRQLYAMLGQPSAGSGGWTAAVSKGAGAGAGGSAAGGTDDEADRGTLRVRTLQRFLAGYKQIDQGRVAAFAKRLAGAALAAEAGEAVGVLGVTRQLLANYPRTRCLLENERVGTGVFNMDVDDPETAVGLAAVLWDLALLRRHYHPAVSAAAAEVAGLPLQGSVPPALGSHAPAELARLHSTTRGTFRPAIPPPRWGHHLRRTSSPAPFLPIPATDVYFFKAEACFCFFVFFCLLAFTFGATPRHRTLTRGPGGNPRARCWTAPRPRARRLGFWSRAPSSPSSSRRTPTGSATRRRRAAAPVRRPCVDISWRRKSSAPTRCCADRPRGCAGSREGCGSAWRRWRRRGARRRRRRLTRRRSRRR